MNAVRRFRVALSYPGEERRFVGEVADALASTLGRERVLYDGYLTAELARPDLDVYLAALYREQSDLLAPFYSVDYERKKWCRLEWRQMRDIIAQLESERIMPFRFDDTPLQGVLSIDGYISVGDRSPQDVAALILQRLDVQSSPAPARQEARSVAAPPATTAGPRVTILLPDDYDTFGPEKQQLLQRLLAAACEVREDQIEILRTRPAGSMEIDLRLPPEAARRLLEQFATGQGPLSDRGIGRVEMREGQTRVFLRHLPTASWALIGRETELGVLDRIVEEGKTRVVSIVAFGGTGKTSLVAAWASRLAAAGWQDFDQVFAWSFYSQGTRPGAAASADMFLAQALAFFGDEHAAASPSGPWQKGERLAQLVGGSRSLLILDGLEPLQDAKTGEIRDEGVRALLQALAAESRSLCVITSRTGIADLAAWRNMTALEVRLTTLSPAAGASLLDHLGVHGASEERERLAQQVHGHPLTLALMGRYLVEAYGGDVRKSDTIVLADADAAAGSHAFHVMNAYEEWLMRDGRTVELAILRLLGLFDRPAPADCLRALRMAEIPSLTQSVRDVDDTQWNTAVRRLAALGLIEAQPSIARPLAGYHEKEAEGARRGEPLGEPHLLDDGGDESQELVIDAHPLIREFFAMRLRDGAPETWRAAHARLFEYLRESVPYWPEGLGGLQPLYQAVFHGTQAGLIQDAFELFVDRIQRGTTGAHAFYSRRVLGAIGADLAAMSSFFAEPWTRPSPALSEPMQTWLLSQAALNLRACGRAGEAVAPMRESMWMYMREARWDAAATVAGNLSEVHLMLGDLLAAQEDAATSALLADRAADEIQQVRARSILGDVLHQAGNEQEAKHRFEEAESRQRSADPSQPWLMSLQGFRYADLLSAQAERAAWRVVLYGEASNDDDDALLEIIRRAETMWNASAGARMLLGLALANLSLARARLYHALLEPKSAGVGDPLIATPLEDAVHQMREASAQNHLPRALLTRAWLRASLGRFTEAHTDLAEARQLAERGPMPLFLADVCLHAARLFYQHDSGLARADLVHARRLIEKHAYRRRLVELEDAEKAIFDR